MLVPWALTISITTMRQPICVLQKRSSIPSDVGEVPRVASVVSPPTLRPGEGPESNA